jgi:hypothetical protein
MIDKSHDQHGGKQAEESDDSVKFHPKAQILSEKTKTTVIITNIEERYKKIII